MVGEEAVDAGVEERLDHADHVALRIRVRGGAELRVEELVLGAEGVRHHLEARAVGEGDERGLLAHRAVLLLGDDLREGRAERVDAGRADLAHARGGLVEVVVADGVAGGHGVVGRAVDAGEEHRLGLEAEVLVEIAQVGELEGLHGGGGVALVQAVLVEQLDDALLHGQADGVEVGGVLDLGDDADLAAVPGREALPQLEHLLEGGHLVPAVVGRGLGADLRQALLGAQGLELGEGEVLGEPAGEGHAVDDLGGPAVRELGSLGDVRGAVDQVLVADHEHAVLGGDQVRLDHIRALGGGQLVGGQGVLGAVAGGTTMTHDVGTHHGLARDGLRGGRGLRCGGGGDGRGGQRGADGDGGGEGHEAAGGVTTDGGHGTVLSGRGMTAPVGQIRVSAGWPPSGHSRPVR